MKIGLFFGSFNPIHIGHTALASYIVEQGLVDELWFVVSPHNPLKEKDGLLDAGLRLKMVQTAVAGYAKFRVCDVEFSLSQPSYTVDTLRYLRNQYPERQFSLIMGADSLANINKWKNYEEILLEYPLLVYPRPNIIITDFPQTVTVLNDAPLLDISATFVRELLETGRDIRYFVPNGVGEILQNISRS